MMTDLAHLAHMLLIDRTHHRAVDFLGGLPGDWLLHRVGHHHLVLLVHRLVVRTGDGHLVGVVLRAAGGVALLSHMLLIDRVAGGVRHLVFRLIVLGAGNGVRNVPDMLLIDGMAGGVRHLVLGLVVLGAGNGVRNVPDMLLIDGMAGGVRHLVLGLVVLGTGNGVRNIPDMLLLNRLVMRAGHRHLVGLHLGTVHRHRVLTHMLLVNRLAHRLAHDLILVLDDRTGNRVAMLTDLGFCHRPKDSIAFLPQFGVINGLVSDHRFFLGDHPLAYPIAYGAALLHRHDPCRILAGTAMRSPRFTAQPQASQRQDTQKPKGSPVHPRAPSASRLPCLTRPLGLAFLSILPEHPKGRMRINPDKKHLH